MRRIVLALAFLVLLAVPASVSAEPRDSVSRDFPIFHSIFEFSPCHRHFHITGFTDYRLLNLNGTVAADGHKQAFCLEDLLHYSNDLKSNGYTCADQGITSGWADWYFKQLSGQWIDITGVQEGDYRVQVRINAAGTFPEGQNRYPDVIETLIHVPDPRNKVTLDTSALQYGG